MSVRRDILEVIVTWTTVLAVVTILAALVLFGLGRVPWRDMASLAVGVFGIVVAARCFWLEQENERLRADLDFERALNPIKPPRPLGEAIF